MLSEVHRREDFAFAVGGGMVKDGNSRARGEGAMRAELQKERDGGNSLLATADSSIRQQHSITFSTLKHTGSSCNPAI